MATNKIPTGLLEEIRIQPIPAQHVSSRVTYHQKQNSTIEANQKVYSKI